MKKGKILFILLSIIPISIVIIILFNLIFNNIDKEIIRVEVLNGTNVNGLAEKTSNYLRNQKLDVIIVSNAKSDTISRTIVIDRMNKRGNYAKFVAEKMKCENIIVDIDSSLYIDVTVIVGNDYREFLME